MNLMQVAYAIYNYLFNESARLEIEAEESGKYVSDKSDFAYLERFAMARLKYEHFREFSAAIFEILRYYEGET